MFDVRFTIQEKRFCAQTIMGLERIKKGHILIRENPCYPSSRTTFHWGRIFGAAFECCFVLVEFDVACCSCWDKMQNQTNGPPQRVLHPRLGLGQVSVSLGAPRMPQTYIITTPKQDPKKSATKRKDASLDPTQGLPRMQNHQCELVLMVAQKI